jgi:hypothetical protein
MAAAQQVNVEESSLAMEEASIFGGGDLRKRTDDLPQSSDRTVKLGHYPKLALFAKTGR